MASEPILCSALHQSPAVLVRFTVDMVDTLRTYFQAYQRDDVVTLQMTERGLWLVNPHNDSRQFLGQAVLSEAQLERLRRVRGGLN